jgi:hypothetical protein
MRHAFMFLWLRFFTLSSFYLVVSTVCSAVSPLFEINSSHLHGDACGQVVGLLAQKGLSSGNLLEREFA